MGLVGHNRLGHDEELLGFGDVSAGGIGGSEQGKHVRIAVAQFEAFAVLADRLGIHPLPFVQLAERPSDVRAIGIEFDRLLHDGYGLVEMAALRQANGEALGDVRMDRIQIAGPLELAAGFSDAAFLDEEVTVPDVPEDVCRTVIKFWASCGSKTPKAATG